jgi:hypothetical protein
MPGHKVRSALRASPPADVREYADVRDKLTAQLKAARAKIAELIRERDRPPPPEPLPPKLPFVGPQHVPFAHGSIKRIAARLLKLADDRRNELHELALELLRLAGRVKDMEPKQTER